MTLTVLKSQLGEVSEEDFARSVEFFRKSLEDHRLTEGVPAPTAPAIIESAIRRVPTDGGMDEFVADYVVHDDTPPPPPEPTEAEIRARKVMDIRLWEQEAIARVMPPERMRLANLDYARAVRVPVDDRTEAQKAIVAKHEADMAALEDIQYEAAQREAELA